MPAPDLTDEELAAIVALLRRLLNNDPLTFSPQMKQLKSALEKLDPKPANHALSYRRRLLARRRGAIENRSANRGA
jgi:hypothetical protein